MSLELQAFEVVLYLFQGNHIGKLPANIKQGNCMDERVPVKNAFLRQYGVVVVLVSIGDGGLDT